jgi:uncharacterized membrane protein YccC
MSFFKEFIDIERLIHSFKTAIACLLGFLLARIIGLPADQWVVITIIVVMCAQIYVGSVMQKAYLRFLGTIFGCLFAMVTIVAVGDSGLAVAVTVAISSFIFSYFATMNESFTYAGTLGAVTTAIIMLGQTPTMTFAAERFLEISVGLLIATLVSQFILPIHARTHLRRAQVNTLELLRNYFTAVTSTSVETIAVIDYQELDDNVGKSIIKQRALAKESKNELFGVAFNADIFMQCLACERGILRSMTFIQYAYAHLQRVNPDLLKSSALHDFNEVILKTLDTFINVIQRGKKADDHIHSADMLALRGQIQQHSPGMSQDAQLYIDGLLFSAEILVNNLTMLARLYFLPIK